VIAVENSCRIGGRATDGGAGVSGVTISLTGTHTDSATTDASGNYVFAGLRCGGDYTVSASKAGYTFSPPSINYANLSQDQMAANFSRASLGYSISGRVTSGGAGLSGVTVTLTGTQGGSTTTDSGGYYSFPDLAAGGNYILTPWLTNYTFVPQSRTYTNLSGNQTGANFEGTIVTYTVSGRITVAGSGASLAGVTVTLTGTQDRSTQTDGSGNYSFTGLPGGGNYIFTPSLTGYHFEPQSRSYPNLSANETSANFEGSTATYTISGRVTEVGLGVSGVTMNLTGSQSASTSTDASGYYVFGGLAAGGSYTVTPSKTNFTFTPTSASFSSLTGSETANFAGNQYPFAVGVSPSVSVNRRQTLTFTFRDPDGYSDLEWTVTTINTTLDGNAGCVVYFVPSVPTHVYLGDNTWDPQWREITPGTGSPVTTSQGMCTLYPASSSITLSGTDVILSMDLEIPPAFSGYKNIWMSEKDGSHADYVYWVALGGWTVPGQIRGQVTMGSSGLSGVTMTLSGCRSATTTTDGNGNYSFEAASGALPCTVVPSKPYYTFAPELRWMYPDGVQTANFTVTASVTLTNLTRPGHDTDYRVGDSFALTIYGPPNQTVGITATHNGETFGSTQGQTDSTGHWSSSGTMGGGEVGNWTEVWTVGPVQATPTLNFTVSPSVTLVNLTRPGHDTDFRVGDSFALTIYGPPNQTVGITATHNGETFGSTQGQTDSNGHWSSSGTMGSGEIGNWTEVWTVGPYTAIPTLNFTVSP
jgi:hypothetical protein